MRLSDGERLIIIMLADIMGTMKVDSEIDSNLVKTLAYNHDDWAISRKYPGIFASEEPEIDIVKETTDILWMWGIIEHAIGKLQGDDAAEAAAWHWAKFTGFDGNNDRHYGVAHTMINELEEFQDFKDRYLNSHSRASLPRYLSMYQKFDKYIARGTPLSVEALRDLCS